MSKEIAIFLKLNHLCILLNGTQEGILFLLEESTMNEKLFIRMRTRVEFFRGGGD